MSLIKLNNKERRRKRVRAKISGTADRPRLSVYKSNKALHVQLIDDEKGETLFGKKYESKTGTIATDEVQKAGADLVKEAKNKDIKTVVFDRGPFRYAGRIRAFAESVREAGLEF